MSESEKTFGAVLTEAAKELVKADMEFAKSIDTSETVVSERTLRRVRRKIRNYDKESKSSERSVIFRRAVAAVIVACTVSFGLCMSVDAVREKIISTIVEWYDKFVSVFYVAEETPPDVIVEYKEPTLNIEGVEKHVLVKKDKIYSIMYTKDDAVVIKYQQIPITTAPSKLNNEECIIEEIEINGTIGHYLVYGNGSSVLIWVDKEYRFMINSFKSDIDLDTLISIAKSIK